MAITLQRKPTPLQAWHLTDQAAMFTALDELGDLGWRGGMTRDQAGSWRLELNADITSVPTTVIALLGDWLILDGGLRAISDEDCTDQYEAAE